MLNLAVKNRPPQTTPSPRPPSRQAHFSASLPVTSKPVPWRSSTPLLKPGGGSSAGGADFVHPPPSPIQPDRKLYASLPNTPNMGRKSVDFSDEDLKKDMPSHRSMMDITSDLMNQTGATFNKTLNTTGGGTLLRTTGGIGTLSEDPGRQSPQQTKYLLKLFQNIDAHLPLAYDRLLRIRTDQTYPFEIGLKSVDVVPLIPSDGENAPRRVCITVIIQCFPILKICLEILPIK